MEGDGNEEAGAEQPAPPAAAAAGGEQQQPGDGQQPAAQQGEEDGEDDKPLLQNYKMSKARRKGTECPYLDTISRQVGARGGRCHRRFLPACRWRRCRCCCRCTCCRTLSRQGRPPLNKAA